VSQILLLLLDWRKFLLYVWAPHFFAQWGIVSMNMLQHDGCDPDVDHDSSVEVKNYNGARNFVGPVINYLTFNNGYHTIHHMKPTLHWSQLPVEHERLVKYVPSALCLVQMQPREPVLLCPAPVSRAPPLIYLNSTPCALCV